MEKTYTLGLYEKAMPADLSWEERFREAKAAGFDYIEISIDESDARLSRLEYSREQIREITDAGFAQGMYLGSICLSGHRKYPLGGDDEKSLEIMEKAVDFAHTAGIPIIQLAGYDVYYTEGTEETRMRFQKNLKQACAMAARKGILLGFETMETPFMNTVGKAMAYVEDADSPYLQVYPDIGNLNNAAVLYGKRVCDDLEFGRGHLIAAHIKETVPGKYREIPFGTGDVAFEKILKKTWELGVRKYVTELWFTDNDWRKDIREAAILARTILDKE